MSVTHGSHGVVATQPPVSSLEACDVATIGHGRGHRRSPGLYQRARVSDSRLGRPGPVGRVIARLGVAEQHLCDQAFNATAVWRSCNIEGYLERKLHRQWRTRGS